jgi:hypothetical protein
VYRQLDDDRIIETLSGFVTGSASDFRPRASRVVRRAAVSSASRPNASIRCSSSFVTAPTRVGVAITAMLAVIAAAASQIRLASGVAGWPDFVQGVEAAINDLVFLGIAIFFLLTIETRLKRRRALAALHQLRSIAHVVDMHQLTKDPEQLLTNPPATASSPARTMTRVELGRYLDYCSEMLSLTSKIAALFVERFDDPVTLAAVNEIESLTARLSRKIWRR